MGEHLTFFIVFSKERGNTSKISLSQNLIDMKARNKHHVSVLKPYLFVLACLPIELHWNLKVCCLQIFFFFSKFGLPNWGCGLSMGVAYTWTLTVTELTTRSNCGQ